MRGRVWWVRGRDRREGANGERVRTKRGRDRREGASEERARTKRGRERSERGAVDALGYLYWLLLWLLLWGGLHGLCRFVGIVCVCVMCLCLCLCYYMSVLYFCIVCMCYTSALYVRIVGLYCMSALSAGYSPSKSGEGGWILAWILAWIFCVSMGVKVDGGDGGDRVEGVDG